ncbi:MAG: hypothetical protein U0573_03185 [Phycisphaerales bacterium]|nr:hypothetical protein [Planctomycetota bacterium]
MGNDEKKSISRSLGEFFGHILKGVKEPVEDRKLVLRADRTEEVRETESGKVIVRRTVVEEMEVVRDVKEEGRENEKGKP